MKYLVTPKNLPVNRLKSLIDKILMGLLRLDFKSNNTIKSNTLKYIVKKILPDYK